jgi:hypothetical protein
LWAFLGGWSLTLLSGLPLLLLYGVCLTNPSSPTYYADKFYMMWTQAWAVVVLAAASFVSGLTLMVAAAVLPLFYTRSDDD